MSAEYTMPDECPPSSASPMNGTFYRLVRAGRCDGAMTDRADWRKPYKSNVGDCSGGHDRCECHAFSLFSIVEDAVKAISLVPGLGAKRIAEISIDPNMGVLQRSPSFIQGGEVHDSHHDWWPAPTDLLPQASVIHSQPGIS